MGNQLTTYTGSVVFMDLLGFGALTRGQIKLEKKDIEPWTDQFDHPCDHHFLAANLLVRFREILSNLEQTHPDVIIAQLSDSFFAWSVSTISIIRFTHDFMWQSLKSGLLCRGGLAHGPIIETQSNHQLGRLILGEAVTKAVGFESLAKGARILTEPDVIMAMYEENQDEHMRLRELIEPFENPLDFQTYDEFKWFLVNDLNKISPHGLSNNSDEEKIKMTKERLKLNNELLYSSLFSWNSKNIQGMIQLNATNNILSEDGLIGIYHDFRRRRISEGSRSKEIVEIRNKLVEDAKYESKPLEDLLH